MLTLSNIGADKSYFVTIAEFAAFGAESKSVKNDLACNTVSASVTIFDFLYRAESRFNPLVFPIVAESSFMIVIWRSGC